MGQDKEAVALGVEVRVELVEHARGEAEVNPPLRDVVERAQVGDEDFEGLTVGRVDRGSVQAGRKLGCCYLIHRLGVEGAGRSRPRSVYSVDLSSKG